MEYWKCRTGKWQIKEYNGWENERQDGWKAVVHSLVLRPVVRFSVGPDIIQSRVFNRSGSTSCRPSWPLASPRRSAVLQLSSSHLKAMSASVEPSTWGSDKHRTELWCDLSAYRKCCVPNVVCAAEWDEADEPPSLSKSFIDFRLKTSQIMVDPTHHTRNWSRGVDFNPCDS